LAFNFLLLDGTLWSFEILEEEWKVGEKELPVFRANLEPVDESWNVLLHQLFAFAISFHVLHLADSVWNVSGLVHKQGNRF